MRCASCGAENPEGFRFCGTCGAPLTAEAPRETRKVVTVLFCDLSGSTALGDTTDPETLRATMRGYYEQMRTILERHGGTVEKFVGDAVMAVFGVPVSHEDDALRAVRAAWEMRAAVPALGLAARIGVNTGEVVAGEGDSLVTGDAVNVAARLEQAADVGDVLIGGDTRALVRDAVEVEPVEVTAKGKPEPVAAFRLLDVDLEAAAIARRLDTPLVGRSGELDQLRQAFDRAVRERRCHLFTLLGPAGVGKSRLVAEFLAAVDATILEGRCLDYGDGITWWPVISVLKQLGERADATVAKVIEGGNEVPWAVRTLFEEIASERPLVVVFDDIQWGEETFLDLVDHIADMSRGAPLLLLCVARPELLDKRPGWGGGKLNATAILLEPLTPEECAELIAVHGGVDADVRQRILDAADGNPLFVEEMVALVHEDGGDVRVPSSVQALLQARIDQLGGEERSVIERGAVEGEIFHRGAVAELARPADVDPQLVGLVRKELIRPERAALAGDQAFRFRHLLIRDAAYEALPKETRASLHARFANWLQEHGTALIELDEILGYHLEQAARYLSELGRRDARLGARAGGHLADAGRRAAKRGDGPAALKLLRRALDLLPARTPLWERTLLDRLALLVDTAEEDERSALIEQLLNDPDPRLVMHGRLAQTHLDLRAASLGTMERAEATAAEAFELFDRLGDDMGLAATWDLRAWAAWVRASGRATAAAIEEYLKHAARAEPLDYMGRTDVVRFGPYVHGPFTHEERRRAVADLPPDALPRAIIEAEIAEDNGDYDAAVANQDRLLAHFSKLGLPMVALPARTARAYTLWNAGRLEEADQAYRELLGFLEEMNLGSFASTSLIEHGFVRYTLGDLDGAEERAVRGESLGSPDDTINFVMGRAVRAHVAADRGDTEAAIRLAESSVEYAERCDFPHAHGFALESLGYALRAAGRTVEARAIYEKALANWERFDRNAKAARVRELLVEL